MIEEEAIQSIVDTEEPQVTSSDPNERKLARKLRIERRLEAIRRQNMPDGTEEEIEHKTLLQQQLKNSTELLEKLVIEGNELVTNVRVANDSREVDRREEEGIGREKIIEQLEEESESAKEKFDEIADKWSSILKYNDPLHINDELISQREKCEELIKQKDGIIAMLKDELKQAEIKFGKDQRKQNEDICTLTNRIEKQVTLMRRAFRQEFRLIEEAIMTERRALIEMHNKKWEELYKKRAVEEESNSDKKFQQQDEFEEELNKLRRNFQEKYREAKIKLENDSENLQQELEKIKALSLLNSEKVDYNYQILKKREDENIIIKSQQKRRINKLQDVINGLRRKIRDYQTYAKEHTEKLTTQIQKLQSDIMKIEEKADHFQINNDMKFHQVWNLNKEIADKLLEEILTTDRIIYEQQLGVKWTPPEQKVLEKTELPSFKSAMEVILELGDRSSNKDILLKHSGVLAAANKGKSGQETAKNSEMVSTTDTAPYRRLTRLILKKMSDKTGFFLEERLKIILQPYADEQRTLVRLDNVFAALGIKKSEDISLLVDFFIPYTHCPVCSATAGSVSVSMTSSEQVVTDTTDFGEDAGSGYQTQEFTSLTDINNIISAVQQPDNVVADIILNIVEESSSTSLSLSYESSEEVSETTSSVTSLSSTEQIKPIKEYVRISEKLSCQHHHPLTISPVYVLRALREFVYHVYAVKPGDMTMSVRLANKRNTISRMVTHDDIEIFWRKYLTVFSQFHVKVWDGLYSGLKKYHAILEDRKQMNEEVINLRQQNAELKQLLAKYIEKTKKTPPCAKQREGNLRASPPGSSCRRL